MVDKIPANRTTQNRRRRQSRDRLLTIAVAWGAALAAVAATEACGDGGRAPAADAATVDPGDARVADADPGDTPGNPDAPDAQDRGRLAFSVVAAQPNFPTGNCRAIADGGAGITSTIITVTRADDSCVDMTLQRTVGSTTISSYDASCTSSQQTSCVGDAEVLSARDVAVDTYTIHVTALVGAQSCWSGQATVTAVQSTTAPDPTVVDMTRTVGGPCNNGYDYLTPGPPPGQPS